MSEHFNKLSPAEAERLAMLAEECAEVIVEVNKILRHGYESWNPDDPVAHASPSNRTNRHTLREELNDLHCVAEAMFEAGDIANYGHKELSASWQKKLRYSHHQEAPND